MRNITFHIRLSPDEKSLLEKLAKDFGLSVADIIRLAVREWAQDRKGAGE